jgi:hypothetical protein
MGIRREGRAWQGDEFLERLDLTPAKIEAIDGKLFWSDEQRLTMLGMMLEQVGADRAVRLGDPQVWQGAVAGL